MVNAHSFTQNTSLSRRSFLAVSGGASGAVLLSLMMPINAVSAQEVQANETERFTTGAYIEIATDEMITMTIGQSEWDKGP